MRAVVTAKTVAARFGSETAQKCANVRVAFTPIGSKLFRHFKDLGRGDDVRDEGVAGSNPATPTKQNQRLSGAALLVNTTTAPETMHAGH